MTILRIGQVARATGFTVEAIRYYESIGLIPAAQRSSSGYRQFSMEVVRKLRFVRRAQNVGFSLDETRRLLELQGQPDASASAVRELASLKLAEIEEKLSDLERVRDALLAASCSCDGSGLVRECSILDALDGSGEISG